jgi:beta-glucosidase/6-phospho-beta-glucosidase/beta-galactosidase
MDWIQPEDHLALILITRKPQDATAPRIVSPLKIVSDLSISNTSISTLPVSKVDWTVDTIVLTQMLCAVRNNFKTPLIMLETGVSVIDRPCTLTVYPAEIYQTNKVE